MIERQALETGVRRIGIEQEMYLVDDDGSPRPCAPALLEGLTDPRFTTELARFNLEANFPPYALGHGALGRLEQEIRDAIQAASSAAERLGARPDHGHPPDARAGGPDRRQPHPAAPLHGSVRTT
jgi:hypothetical protein